MTSLHVQVDPQKHSTSQPGTPETLDGDEVEALERFCKTMPQYALLPLLLQITGNDKRYPQDSTAVCVRTSNLISGRVRICMFHANYVHLSNCNGNQGVTKGLSGVIRGYQGVGYIKALVTDYSKAFVNREWNVVCSHLKA